MKEIFEEITFIINKNKKERSEKTLSKGWIYLENALKGVEVGLGFNVICGAVTAGVCFATGTLKTFTLESIANFVVNLAESSPVLFSVALGAPVFVGGVIGLIKSICNTRNEENVGGGKTAVQVK